MSDIFIEGIFILIYRLQSAKRIRIPKPPFLPICCSPAAAPMLSCSRMNRRARKRCAIWRYQGPAIEPGRAPDLSSSALHLQLYIYCINVCYIYIFNYILFFHWSARTQSLARRSQRTVALMHYGRECRAVGGSAHRSAHHDKRAHRSARMARVLHLSH